MLKINPVFTPKLWGGNKLKNEYGFDIKNNEPIGEAWIISAYPGNSSTTDEGIELNYLYKTNKELFNNYHTEDFPLLVKIIDAQNNLSIQVHPNNEKAQELENYSFGKTECWLILDAEKDTDIVIGVNANNKEQASNFIKQKQWDKFLRRQKINKGDLFDIEAGTVHAILGGTVVYELQQSSDITYRLYDFDRKESNGSLRELHIDKSLEVIDYEKKDVKKKSSLILDKDNIKIHSLIKNEIFSLEKWDLNGETTLNLSNNKNFLLVTVIEGKANINGTELETYQSGIITAKELKEINLQGRAVILVGNPN